MTRIDDGNKDEAGEAEFLRDIEEEEEAEERFWAECNRPLNEKDIADGNRGMLCRQQDFRLAAEYVARAFASLPEVKKIVLFGSVAAPLRKEVPRFREFRRAGTAIWHECNDADIAVWVSDLRCLGELRKARGRAVNNLLREKNVGVAHHQIDVFILEEGADRYLGRSCTFAQCPKGKPECLAPGCGATPFLRQHENFAFAWKTVKPEETVLLYVAPLLSS